MNRRKLIILIASVLLLGVSLAQAQPQVEDYPLLIGTYVDGYVSSAADHNVWPTDAASYILPIEWLEDVSGGAPYGKWYPKSGSSKAIDGTAFQGSDNDEPPQLTMTAGVLEPGKVYDIYVVYWAKDPTLVSPANSWYTRAALPGQSLIDGSMATADNLFFYDGGTGVQGCQKYLGQVSDPNLSIIVEAPPNQTGDQRAWLDGLTYVEAGTIPTYTLTINAVVLDPNNWGSVTPDPED